VTDLPQCDQHPTADVIVTVTKRFRLSQVDGRLLPIDEAWVAWCSTGHEMREKHD
jgi:hypothetical protein